MEYQEDMIIVELKDNLPFCQVNLKISNLINKSLCSDGSLIKIHERTGYKPYIFSSLTPIEKKDKVYHKNRIYRFKIRSYDESFLRNLNSILENMETEMMRVLAINFKKVVLRKIKRLKTYNPVIVTVDDGPWLLDRDDPSLLIRQLQANIEKKYQFFFDEKIITDNNFISSLIPLNEKPLALEYKGIKLLGNKFEFFISEDESSQKLANLALATGIGEKNSSLGAGFCVALK